jgi:hypothetical protein
MSGADQLRGTAPHFCPTKSGDVHGVIGGCPVFSMGAYLFAKAMAEPLAVTSSGS